MMCKWSWLVFFLSLSSPCQFCTRNYGSFSVSSITLFPHCTLRSELLSEQSAGATRVLCNIVKFVPPGSSIQRQRMVLYTDCWKLCSCKNSTSYMLYHRTATDRCRAKGRTTAELKRDSPAAKTAFHLDTLRVVPRPATTQWGGAHDLSVPACPTVTHG